MGSPFMKIQRLVCPNRANTPHNPSLHFLLLTTSTSTAIPTTLNPMNLSMSCLRAGLRRSSPVWQGRCSLSELGAWLAWGCWSLATRDLGDVQNYIGFCVDINICI